MSPLDLQVVTAASYVAQLTLPLTETDLVFGSQEMTLALGKPRAEPGKQAPSLLL